LLVQGVLFVLVVLFLPQGVLPAGLDVLRRAFKLPQTSDSRVLTPAAGAPDIAATRTVAVAVNRLEVSFGSLQILRGVDLTVRCSELLAIIGPNGAGKSTLLSVLADGRTRIRGEVSLGLADQVPHRGEHPWRLARAGLIRKFQIPRLFESVTGAEAFVLATHRGRALSPWRHTRVVAVPDEALQVLSIAGVADHLNRRVGELPHGLKQGLEIALAIASRPSVLLMDEPTAGLTHNERAAIGGVLKALAQAGVAVVLIEHDLDFVEAIADRVAVLHGGRVVHEGEPATIRESATVRTAYVGVSE
jgi:branched-chain amino acid transport system permease protein